MSAIQPEDKPDKAQREVACILEEKEKQRQRLITINRRDSTPVLADLAKAGFEIGRISDLYNKKYNYKTAIPILLRWLPQIENMDVKEDIVRALSVTWAKPVAAPILIDEFRKKQNESGTGIKWAIANALSIVADDRAFADIVDLAQDPQHGTARQMLAVSLGNMKDPRAQDVLINLLDDDEVAGHAIIGLGKLKSKKAHQAIERFLHHPKTWVRNEAKKALAKIDKAGK